MTHTHKPSVDSEMHDLNAEADFLEQKTTITSGGHNGEDTKVHPHNTDPDAQAMVIESLRTQVQDLFSQVSQLNNKLVRSYDRVSDLEDELHVTSSNLRQATIKVSHLELERTQHLAALNTGLLVEKSHVTTELNRLMEKATEEAARRGQAESARAEIEKDLDDLSAGLFDQANKMVAEARIAEARSSRKLEDTEAALRSAEEIVGALQAHMQTLESEKEQADRRMEDMRIRMGKGKWVERSPERPRHNGPRLLSTHLPYHDFLVFVSHLRAIRPATLQPPAMSTLLTLPFLARLITEDSDPTVRLDLAPSLNWLSRRSVLAAIHNGQLTVEPMQFTTLLEELAPPNIPANSHHTHVVCALCGMPIYSSDSQAGTPTTPVATPRSGAQSASWSTSLFKNVRAGDITLPTFSSNNTRHPAQFGPPITEPPSQVYVFRFEATSTGINVSLPLSSQPPGTPGARQPIYPLCCTGWCLSRLRATCSLWAFLRTSVVEKIWEEPPMVPFTNGVNKLGVNGAEKKHDGGMNGAPAAPPMQPPPRRSKIGLGSLWGSMQRSLSGTREPESRLSEPSALSKPVDPTPPKIPPRDPSRKTLPPPPPSHPTVSHAKQESVSRTVHRVPPPFRESSPVPVSVPPTSSTPPPLPKRNRERGATLATPEPEPTPAVDGDVVAAVESGEPTPAESAVNDKPKEAEAAPSDDTATETSESSETAPADAKSDTGEALETETAPAREALKLDLHIAPPMSRGPSNDSFRTPTEELGPPLTAHPDAASMTDPFSSSETPPPDQQEKTPTMDSRPEVTDAPASVPGDDPVSAEEAVQKDVPATETAAATPAVAPVASVEKDDKPPSRTGSPAPPPLPRRAAARARPSSMLVPQAEPAKSEAAVPETAASVLPSDDVAERKAGDETPVAQLEAAAATAPEVAAPAPAEPAPLTEEPEQIKPSAEAAASPEEPPASDAPVAPEEPKTVEVNGTQETLPNGHVEETSTLKDVLEEQPSASAPEPEKVAVVTAEEPTAAEADNGQFVGDATWEERTYKELIRLREEMFWARIGATVR